MPKFIDIVQMGAKFGGHDDTEVWQDAINILNGNNGGVIVCDGAGASINTSPLPRFNKFKTPISIWGNGKKNPVLQFQGFDDKPCISFVDDNRDVENFELRNIGIRHTGACPLFRSVTGRFKDSIFDNVYFGQKGDSAETAVEITGGLQSVIRDVTINGGHSGGTGIKFRGTHCELEKVFAPEKKTAPSNFMDVRLVNGKIINCRTEGGNGDFDYRIYDSDHVDVNVYSEGYKSNVSVWINSSKGIRLSGAIGTQISETPIGVLVLGSDFCDIDGLKMSARATNVLFDEIRNNKVSNLRVIKSNYCKEKNDIFNSNGIMELAHIKETNERIYN